MNIELPDTLVNRIYEVLGDHLFTSDEDGLSYNNEDVLEVWYALEPYITK